MSNYTESDRAAGLHLPRLPEGAYEQASFDVSVVEQGAWLLVRPGTWFAFDGVRAWVAVRTGGAGGGA